ncbi:MAG: hypothetical protein ABFS32_08180 [Bacteroidota bacterium]
MRYDIYDCLLSNLGYNHKCVTEDILEQNQEEIDALKKEIGLIKNDDLYNLFLYDDSIHDQLEAAMIIMSLGIPPEEAMWKMYLANNTGSCVLKTAPYNELKRMQDKLKEENYSSAIIKKEKDDE